MEREQVLSREGGFLYLDQYGGEEVKILAAWAVTPRDKTGVLPIGGVTIY